MALTRNGIWQGRPALVEINLSEPHPSAAWNVIPLDEPERLKGGWKWIRGIPFAEVELMPINGIMRGAKVRVMPGHYQYSGAEAIVVGEHPSPGYVMLETVHKMVGRYMQGWRQFAADTSFLEVLTPEENRIEWEVENERGKVHLDWPWLLDISYDRYRWSLENPPNIVRKDKIWRVWWQYTTSELRGTGGINSAQYFAYETAADFEVDDIQAFLRFPSIYLGRLRG